MFLSDASNKNLKGGASQGFIIFWLDDNSKYVPLMCGAQGKLGE